VSTTVASPTKPEYFAWGPFIWVAGLHVGALFALSPAYFTWPSVAVCLFLMWLTGGIGVCLTYHRLLTHRSFVTRPRWLEYVLTALGCCASQGGAIGWVADHRKHHALADREDDVHSPLRGLAWAYTVWWMTPEVTSSRHTTNYCRKWAPDLESDPVHRVLDRIQIVFPLLMFAVLFSLGGLPWLIWGGFVRSVLVLHTTWLVNSATHVWGYRTYPTRDLSTNLWWVALLTFGEGWHNNHHAFPTSARQGLEWWEIDLTYTVIRILSAIGLAHSVKLPRDAASSQTTRSASGEHLGEHHEYAPAP
jgi:stearoyl-CoA desaturase (delta-9 desaturase)